MHVTDECYKRDCLRLKLALRLIRYEALTHTIRHWTGLSDDRVRKLYRSYIKQVLACVGIGVSHWPRSIVFCVRPALAPRFMPWPPSSCSSGPFPTSPIPLLSRQFPPSPEGVSYATPTRPISAFRHALASTSNIRLFLLRPSPSAMKFDCVSVLPARRSTSSKSSRYVTPSVGLAKHPCPKSPRSIAGWLDPSAHALRDC